MWTLPSPRLDLSGLPVKDSGDVGEDPTLPKAGVWELYRPERWGKRTILL